MLAQARRVKEEAISRGNSSSASFGASTVGMSDVDLALGLGIRRRKAAIGVTKSPPMSSAATQRIQVYKEKMERQQELSQHTMRQHQALIEAQHAHKEAMEKRQQLMADMGQQRSVMEELELMKEKEKVMAWLDEITSVEDETEDGAMEDSMEDEIEDVMSALQRICGADMQQHDAGIPLFLQPIDRRLNSMRALYALHLEMRSQLDHAHSIRVSMEAEQFSNAALQVLGLEAKEKLTRVNESIKRAEAETNIINQQLQFYVAELQRTEHYATYIEENGWSPQSIDVGSAKNSDRATVQSFDGVKFPLPSVASIAAFHAAERDCRSQLNDLKRIFPRRSVTSWWRTIRQVTKHEFIIEKQTEKKEKRKQQSSLRSDSTTSTQLSERERRWQASHDFEEDANDRALREMEEGEVGETTMHTQQSVESSSKDDQQQQLKEIKRFQQTFLASGQFSFNLAHMEEGEDGVDSDGMSESGMKKRRHEKQATSASASSSSVSVASLPNVADLYNDVESPDRSLKRASSVVDSILSDIHSSMSRKAKRRNTRGDIPVFHAQTVGSLAGQMKVPVREIIEKMRELDLGHQTTKSIVRDEIARLLVEEFGFNPVDGNASIQPEEQASLRKKAMKSEEYLKFPPRPIVVCVMGHVDHGKTTLLDRLRNENRAVDEAGGITQAIGAFRVELGQTSDSADSTTASSDPHTSPSSRPTFATFLDTPGHAAFRNMRSRGASRNCTDVIVLVISAVDGMMPQTLEVIHLARKNRIPIIVAINKCDISGANPDEIKKQLMVHDVTVESMGGDILSANISAKTGEGIDELKDHIRLTAEMLQLHADQQCPGEAYVIETTLLKRGGSSATVLVRNGRLMVGDYFVCGLQYGRIRALLDEHGKKRQKTLPGESGQLLGLRSLDDMTEDLWVVESEERAMKIVEERRELLDLTQNESIGAEQFQRNQDQKAQVHKIQITRRRSRVAQRPLTEDERSERALDDASLPVLLKADVNGSLEVLRNYFLKLPSVETRVSILRSSLGEINVADIEYAEQVGDGVVFGFNVQPTSEAALLARIKGIRIICHNVMYSLWDEAQRIVSERLPVEMVEKEVGVATIAQLFHITLNKKQKNQALKANTTANANTTIDPRAADLLDSMQQTSGDGVDDDDSASTSLNEGVVAGCRIRNGRMDAKMRFKLMRDDEVIMTGSCLSLRVGRDSKSLVESGECGIRLSGDFDRLAQVGDQIVCVTDVRKERLIDDSEARGVGNKTGEDDMAAAMDEFYA